jgi:hypothetical protein
MYLLYPAKGDKGLASVESLYRAADISGAQF